MIFTHRCIECTVMNQTEPGQRCGVCAEEVAHKASLVPPERPKLGWPINELCGAPGLHSWACRCGLDGVIR